MGRYQTYEDVRAVCPYYTGSTPIDVRCEGIGGGTCLIVRFANGKLRDDHRQKFCDNMAGYDQCPVKKAHEI